MPTVDQREVPPAIPGLQLIKKIGSGGFGEVWLARHQTIGSQLRAVKVVHRDAFSNTADFREEFKGLELFREISRESTFLVSIYQVGHDDDLYFYEMDLADDAKTGAPCDGSEAAIVAYEAMTLNEKVRRSPGGYLPAKWCCRIGRDLAEAVECLHNEGFTHRDIKPENIVFVKGIPKLADIGTMANQAARKPVMALGYTPDEGAGSPKADIFSLGRTLFFASSGRDPLHHFGSYPDAYYQQDVLERKKLEAIVDKATHQSPKARYGSIHVLTEELESLAVAIAQGEKKRRWLIAGATIVVFGGALAALSPLVGDRLFHNKADDSPSAPVSTIADPPAKPPPVDTSLRVVVLSQSGKDISSAEVYVGLESHAINWNSPEGWQSAEAPLTVPTSTPLYISVQAEGYKPRDLSVLELAEGDDMPHFRNVTLVPKPGGILLGELAANLTLYLRQPDGTPAIARAGPDGRLPLPPERTYRFELIAGEVHQVHPHEVTIAPGVFAPLDVPEIEPSMQPIFDPRLKAPWENSLAMSFVNVSGHDVMWSRYETRLGDFRLFCQETGLDFRVFETSLWDREKADRDFVRSLTSEEQEYYKGLEREEQRRFIEDHPQDSERKRRLHHPLTRVTLPEILAFCEWLTKRERALGLLSPELQYRLPSDAEWSAIVGIREPIHLVDPEQSGLSLLNLVDAGVITLEELRNRRFHLDNLANVFVTREQLAEFTPDTQRFLLQAVRIQQLEIRIDAARSREPVTIWGNGDPRPGVGNLAGDAFDPYRNDTAPVEETAVDANGIHCLAGNVSEAVGETHYDQLVLRGPSWTTDPTITERTSQVNHHARMTAHKEVRNVSFGFRLVLAKSTSNG